MLSRRAFLKTSIAAAVAGSVPGQRFIRSAYGTPLAIGLSDPALQPKFVNHVPNALDPGFMYAPDKQGRYKITVADSSTYTGLVDAGGMPLKTPFFGYKGDGQMPTWPGRTFEIQAYGYGSNPEPETLVRWSNDLPKYHLLPVDTSVHWCFSLHGASSRNGVDYTKYSIEKSGVPIITHVHGGHSDFQFDGNPEFFHTPREKVLGPSWDLVPGGFPSEFRYDNNVPAGNLWYHDHALGLTRLNVYAGLAGFYFVRDNFDTGKPGNPAGLPAFPYELAYAIQDRMFRDTGEFFYSAFPGDPFYDGFITGEGAVLPLDLFPGGGPTALAEFFGDHMVVNGLIWPKQDVEPRKYRMHLLNGTDSRFMVLRFREAAGDGTGAEAGTGPALPFYVVGSDQGLSSTVAMTDILVFEPGSRYDIVFDFAAFEGKKIVMENLGTDSPFGGDVGDPDPDDLFPDRQTDRIMRFDVVLPKDNSVPDAWSVSGYEAAASGINPGNTNPVDNVRRVALFEGTDEFGRLQPLLGTVSNDLSQATAYTWFQPTTETPAVGSNEIWEIYNFTGDAHPIHLHLVNFKTEDRHEISFTEAGTVPTVQHNGTSGEVANIQDIVLGAPVALGPADGYVETSMKDMVTALPEQVTRIRVSPFDKQGRYVWHCHILSHEDHEMMRVLEVGG